MYKTLPLLMAVLLSACAVQTPPSTTTTTDVVDYSSLKRDSGTHTVNMQWIEPPSDSPVALIADHRYALTPIVKEATRKARPVVTQVGGTQIIEYEQEQPAKVINEATAVLKKPVHRSETTIKIVPLPIQKKQSPKGSTLYIGASPENSAAEITSLEEFPAEPLTGTTGSVRIQVEANIPTPSEAVAPTAPVLPVTIYFDLDRAELKQKEKTQLDAIPAGMFVTVDGYTCSLGKEQYNLKLSDIRAQAVANYLKSRGVLIVKQEGKGECCPVSTDKSKNRRVVIDKP